MKVSELTGRALDRWVAEALGYVWVDVSAIYNEGDKRIIVSPHKAGFAIEYLTTISKPPARSICWDAALLPFSSSWQDGGPIIDAHAITVTDGLAWAPYHACIGYSIYSDNDWIEGDTYLIAAMRAYVASVYGKEVPDDQP